ncbi:MAG: DUF6079 family protein [Acidobacteriota bacterium]|nr:DUF6079 family protein [Acidobacteriota bacterium]
MTGSDEFSSISTRPGKGSAPGQALEWAAVITGRPEVQTESADFARNALTQWWSHSTGCISGKISDFPEPFRTTRFRKDIRFIEAPLTALKPAFDSLQIGESSFSEAMDHVGRTFAWDKDRLLRWKEGLESLAALISWLPAFMRALDYVNAALPLGREEIDRSREDLLCAIHEPYRFLESQARIEFETRFLEFKKSYATTYYFLHEDALNIVGGLKKDAIKVDPIPLRNLDLLSSLPHMDKSYLNRVKLLARWVQRNQCHLPVRQILEHYPRCYCNFNPASRQQPADSVAHINSAVRNGIESLRASLRRCASLIATELKAQHVDDSVQQSVDVLLGDGPMLPLKAPTIKILSRIISKYPNEFLALMRKK